MERPHGDEITPVGVPAPTDFFFFEGELRAFWRIALFGGLYVPSLFGALLLVQWAPLFPHSSLSYLTVQYLVAFFITGTVLRLVEKKPFSFVGLGISMVGAHQAGFGLLLAAMLMSAVAFLQVAAGLAHWNIGVPAVGTGLAYLGEGAIYFIVVGFGEELLFRGYCFQALIRGTNTGVAIVSSSLVFSLMHIWNPHITLFSLVNVGLAGALFGLAYIRSGALWLPAGMHVAWNFFQGPVYGFPVSGIPARSILLADDRGAAWLTGGAFGPEGGAVATMALAAGILFFLLPDVYRRWMPAERMTFPDPDSGTTLV